MQIARFKTQYLPTTILIVVGLLVGVFTHSDAIAWDPAEYAESAHGNTDPGYGVNRSEAGHDIGDCANCHDTFDDSICGVNPLMLFEVDDPDSQINNFCFQCHKSDSAAQQVTNYTFSRNFGGGDATFTTIYDAFNPTTGSSHNLKDIQDYTTGKVGFTQYDNPCCICHNPHTAQRNYPVEYSDIELGGVKTAIRRPIEFASRPTNLWGDEDFATSGLTERTKDVMNSYQSPYYGNVFLGATNYPIGPFEPAGDATDDGSNLPNFSSACQDCHKNSNVPSTEHGTLRTINWTAAGDVHGLGLQDNGVSGKWFPYRTVGVNYVLSCTDCHEPHGSPNKWLLRTTVNSKVGLSVSSGSDWWDFCTACHTSSHNPGSCSACHLHGGDPGL